MRRNLSRSHRKAASANPVYQFLKDNAPVLTLFTTLGTLLALLPTFYEKIGNSVMLGSYEFNGLILLFLSGVLFVFWTILIILLIYEAANTRDNLAIAGLSFTLFIFLYGVLSSVFNIVKQYLVGDFVQWYVLLSFIVPLLIIIGYGILISIKNPNIKINQKKTPIFPLILVALVLTGCFLFWLGVNIYFNNYTTDRHKFLMDKFEQNTSLLTESEFYNPTIPNTIGQGLYLSDLTGLTPKDLTDYTFRWTTNYGYFITWLPDEKRAIYLSNDTVIPGNKSFGKIFWTFSKEDIGKNKPPVSIRLKIENSSQIYQNIQTIFLTWSEIDIAQTEENHTKSIIFQAQKVDCPVTIGTSIYQNQSLQFAVIDKNLTDSQMIVNVASCNDLETLAMTITNAGCKGSTNHICKLCSQENNRLMNMNFFSSF